jgi:hypothetical protein
MKVKIFREWDFIHQQVEVNKWLEENSKINIQNILQSSATAGNSIYTTITIFYTEITFEKIK